MALCTVTGAVYFPSGELARSVTIKFSRVDKSVNAEYLGAVVPADVYVKTDRLGQVDFQILTGKYIMAVGDYSGGAVVPEELTANISDILAIATPGEQLPIWLEQAIAARDAALAAAADAQGSAEDAADSAATASTAGSTAGTIAGAAAAEPFANAASDSADLASGFADDAAASADDSFDSAAAAASSASDAALSSASVQPYPSYAAALSAVATLPTSVRLVAASIDGLVVRWVRQSGGPCLSGGWVPAKDVRPQHFNAIPNAATAEAAHAATLALQAAYDWASANGRPLRLGAFVWVVHLRPEDVSGGVSTYRMGALLWEKDGAVVIGEGIGKTILRNFGTDGTYSVIQMIRLPLQNGVPKITGGLFSNFTVDENCANTLIWDGRIAAVRCAGLKDFTFERVKFCNSGHYGLGLQNGGYVNVTVADCQFENTGKDALDIKNNVEAVSMVSTGFGVKILRPWVKNCARANDPTASACIDVHGWGVIIDSPFFDGVPSNPEANYSALVRFKEGLDTTSAGRGFGAQGGRVTNMTVKFYGGTEVAPQGGLVEVRAPYATITDLMTYGTAPTGTVGVVSGMAYTTVRGGRMVGLTNGVYNRTAFSGAEWNPFDGGEDLTVEGVTFENCTVGVLANRRRTRVTGNRFPGCTTGVQGASSDSTSMTIVGNDFTLCTTPHTLNISTGHIIENNRSAAGFTSFAVMQSGQARHAQLAALESFRFGANYDGDTANIREIFRLTGTANDVNYLQLAGGTTNSPPHFLSQGSDANIDIRFSPKGTGKLRYGTHVDQADTAITGYIEIKDAGGVLRKLAVIT